VSNGLRIRVLRDNASLTRQAYLEFDLEAMMNGEVYADFVVLWLVCHQSRVENAGADPGGRPCWLEVWSKAAQARGTRALEGLRGGVEKAIEALGKGFIGHPANGSLRSALSSGAVSTLELYRQLLRLVYRLIFLFVAEDRQLLYDPAADAESRERYVRFYSTARLRRMAERVRGSRHADLYVALKLVMDKLGNGGAPELGLPALGGFLFSRKAMSALADCELSNEHLLEAVRSLAFTNAYSSGRTRRAVDYKNLGSEELGSIYESLLELHPIVNTAAATFELRSVSGSERKTTGSYYTPSSLIQVLLDSALEPVIQQAVAGAGSSIENQQSAILNLKVIDPACGSGHFLVAASHRLARRLASIRTGEGEPAPEAMRSALRAVIANCIYGVDINPMSVELCKVSLWMEALEPGKPLSFLDAHIQCGDSLVGVAPGLDISEIPDEAFNPAFGDDKATSTALKKRNKRERGGGNKDKAGQLGFRFDGVAPETLEDLARWLADRAAQVDAMPEDDSTQVQAKAKAFDDYHNAREYLKERLELDLWTASFFWSVPKADAESMLAPTQQELIQLRNGGELDARLVEKVRELSERLNFFHWELAFPHVFSGENAGFDCVLANPPWERIKLQEEEFFAARDPEIVAAPNKAARQKLINALVESNPVLAQLFQDTKHAADAISKFVRVSRRYPLTSIGDVNTYPTFAELALNIISSQGRTGIVLPTGIVTDENTKDYFAHLVENQKLVSINGFENESFIFPDVHHSFRFCLMTFAGHSHKVATTDFIFFCRNIEQLRQEIRHFKLSRTEINLLNPNSGTCPVFRTGFDATLAKSIYRRIPILNNEITKEQSWAVHFFRMVDTANDSHMFIQGDNGNGRELLPLYESKLIQQYNHRFATYSGVSKEERLKGQPRYLDLDESKDTTVVISPKYWLKIEDYDKLSKDLAKTNYYIAMRRLARAHDERTTIACLVPKSAMADNMVGWDIDTTPENKTLILANVNSIVYDYLVRQKVGGAVLSHFILKQLPIMPPSAYTPADIDFIVPRVLELVYTAYDLRPFAEDMGYHGEPFRWDEGRRAQVRAELDAYYARLYGLTRDELRYILDPKEIYGEDFPGETFRVLKEKEVKQFG
jgi:hypothetical protein